MRKSRRGGIGEKKGWLWWGCWFGGCVGWGGWGGGLGVGELLWGCLASGEGA